MEEEEEEDKCGRVEGRLIVLPTGPSGMCRMFGEYGLYSFALCT